MEFTRALHYVLFSAVDGTPLASLPLGMTVHARRNVHVEGIPLDEAQAVVEELVVGGFVEIVRMTPDGEITFLREDAREVARQRRFWQDRHEAWPHEPRWPHDLYLTDKGFELHKAVHDRLGELYTLD